MQEEAAMTNTAVYYRVKINHSNETYVYTFQNQNNLKKGDVVIAPTKYGNDAGTVLGEVASLNDIDQEDIQEIIRLAGEEDFQKIENQKNQEAEALEVCRQKIESHGLDMKLVSAHYLIDEPKVLFFFTAEQRVDFRALVKDLVSHFKIRIELRQIGVRDESRVLGGLGVCGRFLCCNNITDKLKPVSIKMAKEQNLSLSSMKISGPCGRLLCCLSYEYDFYKEENRRYPSEGSRISYKSTTYRITEVNILSKIIKLSGSEGNYFDVPFRYFSFNQEKKTWNVDLKEFL